MSIKNQIDLSPQTADFLFESLRLNSDIMRFFGFYIIDTFHKTSGLTS